MQHATREQFISFGLIIYGCIKPVYYSLNEMFSCSRSTKSDRADFCYFNDTREKKVPPLLLSLLPPFSTFNER